MRKFLVLLLVVIKNSAYSEYAVEYIDREAMRAVGSSKVVIRRI